MTQTRVLPDPKCEECGGRGWVLRRGADGEAEKDTCDCYAHRTEGWEPSSPYSSGPRVWWSADKVSVACCREPQVRGGCCVNCGTWTETGSNLPQGDNEG